MLSLRCWCSRIAPAAAALLAPAAAAQECHTVLHASDGSAHDYYGTGVAIDGDVAVIGAWNHAGPDSESGAAYVYRRHGTEWVEEAKLVASDSAANQNFGGTVARTPSPMTISASSRSTSTATGSLPARPRTITTPGTTGSSTSSGTTGGGTRKPGSTPPTRRTSTASGSPSRSAAMSSPWAPAASTAPRGSGSGPPTSFGSTASLGTRRPFSWRRTPPRMTASPPQSP